MPRSEIIPAGDVPQPKPTGRRAEILNEYMGYIVRRVADLGHSVLDPAPVSGLVGPRVGRIAALPPLSHRSAAAPGASYKAWPTSWGASCAGYTCPRWSSTGRCAVSRSSSSR